MSNFFGIIGVVTLLFIAFLLSENKKKINLKTIGFGLSFQFLFAYLF
tara:strand:+ start:853 stop:993 length:141 start_codon:yes stop_codon:yes gene_type:complete